MKIRNEFNVAGCNSGQPPKPAPARPTLTVDVERYQAYLDGADMTEAQKQEFLQALWMIVVSFVELGFGVHPLQDACGKPSQNGSESIKDAFDTVKCDEPRNSDVADDFSP